MQVSSSTTPFRVVALLAVLMLALGAASVATATHELGHLDLPPASYSASVTPDTCEAAVSCTLTFTVRNESPPDSGHLMTEATITAPAGFVVDAVGAVTTSAVVTKNWNASLAGSTVSLSAASLSDGLGPLESFTVPVSVTAPLSALGPGHTFVTSASNTSPVVGTTQFTNNGSDPQVAVVNDHVFCPALEGCETTTVTLDNTSAKAVASSGATDEFLTLSVGGSFAEGSRCLDPNNPFNNFQAKGHPVTTNVTGNDRSHVVTLTLSKTVNNSPGAPGAERFQICTAADEPFWTKSGGFAAENQTTGFFEGLLPDCDATNPLITKCIQSRTRNAGNTVITYFVDPGDPISIPGLGEI